MTSSEISVLYQMTNQIITISSLFNVHIKGTCRNCLLSTLEFEWVWDDDTKSAASCIKDDSREVMFHIDYSCGTAAVRGTMPMKNDQYFWEIKMTTPVYGTDMVSIQYNVLVLRSKLNLINLILCAVKNIFLYFP